MSWQIAFTILACLSAWSGILHYRHMVNNARMHEAHREAINALFYHVERLIRKNIDELRGEEKKMMNELLEEIKRDKTEFIN